MEAEEGLMACGTSGKGRLPEPEAIVENVIIFLMIIRTCED